MNSFRLFTSLALTLVSAVAMANDCAVTDFKDTSVFLQNIRNYLSYVNTTNATNFEERKRDLNIGGQALIKGVPFKAFTDFSDFNSRKTALLSTFDYKLTVNQDTKYDQTILSETDLSAYLACLRGATGLDVVATHQSNNDVTFRIFWNPDQKEEKVTAFEIASTGGQLVSKGIPESGQVLVRPEMPLIYTLRPNEPFHLMVTTVPPIYSVDVDYIIPKFKACRLIENGLDRNPDGSEHITRSTETFHDMNARYVDYGRAWSNVEKRLTAAGHKNIKKLSQSEVDGKDNRHHKIDRDFTFEVSYDALYKEAENPLCGVEEPTVL